MIAAAAAKAANLVVWPAGRPFVRSYNDARPPKSFNPSPILMRFRPIYDSGHVVATAYGGEDEMIALAETVLREADVGRSGVLPAARLRGMSIVRLAYPDDLVLVQLNGPGLRKLKLTRAEIIDTGPGSYPATAQVLYDARPNAQGIVWTSHQADHGDAFILWATRLRPDSLEVLEGPMALDSAPGISLVRVGAELCGVLLQP